MRKLPQHRSFALLAATVAASAILAETQSPHAATMVLKPDDLGEKTNVKLATDETAASHETVISTAGYIAPIQVRQKSGGGSKCLTHALRLGQDSHAHNRVIDAIPTLWRPAQGISQMAHAAA